MRPHPAHNFSLQRHIHSIPAGDLAKSLVSSFLRKYARVRILFECFIPSTLSHQLIFFVDDAAMWTYICTLAVIALNRVVCVAFPVQFKVPSAHDDDFFYIATFEALFTQNLSKSLVLFCVAAGKFGTLCCSTRSSQPCD